MVRQTLHGIARYVYCLVDGVVRARPDWDVGVWTNTPEAWEPLRARFPNLKPWPVVSRPFHPREQWELPRSARRFKPDLVHFCSIAVPLFSSRPFLVTVHDLIPYFFSSTPLHPLYLRYVFRHIARRAERVICVSRWSAGDTVKILGVSADAVRVIPNGGLDGEALAGVDDPEATGGRPYFLCVTNPRPAKNLKVLLDAFGPLEPQFDLVLVSPTADWLEERLRGRSAVRRLHGLSDDGLRSLYRSAQAVVVPSLYEGFGLPALEAMQLGAAVISSSASSLPEVVGEAGLLFDPQRADQLTGLLWRVAEEPGLRADLVRRGHEQALQFSWQASVDSHLELYEQLLKYPERPR